MTRNPNFNFKLKNFILIDISIDNVILLKFKEG